MKDYNSIKLPPLSDDQLIAFNQIRLNNGVSVLKGVTGSGKTEIYFYLILEAIKNNKQALFLVPEIGLSLQIISRFKERFGFDPLIWNSSISKSMKYNMCMDLISSTREYVMIGARSALMLPHNNLGIIIVDEEHDQSYKQDSYTPYNARDMAVLRGFISSHPVLLGSATPSIETMYNVSLGKYQLIKIISRFNDVEMPFVHTIDMRKKIYKNNILYDSKNNSGTKSTILKSNLISLPLERAICKAISKHEQVMIYLNKKGYAPYIVCINCGNITQCKNCSSYMVMHKLKNQLECHYCGFIKPIRITCAKCNEEAVVPYGAGVERVAEEVRHKIPHARVKILTKDEMSKKSAYKILEQIQSLEIDIIIGTQAIAKGYHFDKLTTVGIIDADFGLNSGDLRASERVFQLLHQVSGRAGRNNVRGLVYLQTFNPHSLFIKMLTEHRFDDFISNELNDRIKSNFPPITRAISILISSKSELRALIAAKQISSISQRESDKFNIKVLGPVETYILKIRKYYRYRIILITPKKFNNELFLTQLLSEFKKPHDINLKIDVDPYVLD